MIKRMAALPALGLAVSGCVTNLAAVKDDTSLPPVGLPYQLPRTVVTATVVWTLERCDAVTIETDATGNLLSATNQNGEKLSLIEDDTSVVNSNRRQVLPSKRSATLIPIRLITRN